MTERTRENAWKAKNNCMWKSSHIMRHGKVRTSVGLIGEQGIVMWNLAWFMHPITQ